MMRRIVLIGAACMAALARTADVLVPRFIKEEVALRLDREGYRIVCAMADVRPHETFDAVATMRSFNLFGKGLRPHMVGRVRPWPGRLKTGHRQHRARRRE